jgi:hypothetical protein
MQGYRSATSWGPLHPQKFGGSRPYYPSLERFKIIKQSYILTLIILSKE